MVLIIPAIDLKDGRCVRLFQGRMDQATVYSDDPPAMARRWAELGARRLHVVDLDGAIAGRPANLEVIEGIVREVSIPVQVGGGIRSLETIQLLLERGVSRVILGTVAVEEPQLVAQACARWPGRVMVGIDVRDGRVAVRGWVAQTDRSAGQLAREMADLGVEELIVTDISRDGTLTGPNLAMLEEVARAGGVKVIASGGVSSIDDILAVARLEDRGVSGVIVGKALYTGDVDLAEALAALEGLKAGDGEPESRA